MKGKGEGEKRAQDANILFSFSEQWATVLNKWGDLMLSSVSVVARMIAVGIGLPVDTLTDLMHQGPHLLAPTGSDLSKFGDLDTIFAGFHYVRFLLLLLFLSAWQWILVSLSY